MGQALVWGISSVNHVTSLWLTIISFCEGGVGVFTNFSGCLLNYRDNRKW